MRYHYAMADPPKLHNKVMQNTVTEKSLIHPRFNTRERSFTVGFCSRGLRQIHWKLTAVSVGSVQADSSRRRYREDMKSMPFHTTIFCTVRLYWAMDNMG